MGRRGKIVGHLKVGVQKKHQRKEVLDWREFHKMRREKR